MSQSNLIVLTNNIDFHKEVINTCKESVKSKEQQCEVLRKLFSNLQDEIIKEQSTISMINGKLNILLKEQEELQLKVCLEKQAQNNTKQEVVVEEEVVEEEPKRKICYYIVKNKAYACTEGQKKRIEAYKKWKPFLSRRAKKYASWEKFNNFLLAVSQCVDEEVDYNGKYNDIVGEYFFNHFTRENMFGCPEDSKSDFHIVDKVARDFFEGYY